MADVARRLTAGGRRLEFAWYGPGPSEAPTLVFLHDGLGCAATWRDFPEVLARAAGFGALVYTRAGYGGSDPVPLPRPLDYLQREGDSTLGDVLDATGILEAYLVGHSDGASISLLHASTPRAVPRVRGLLLEAPHVFCEPVTAEGIERLKEEYRRGPLREKLARHHGRNLECAFRGWCDAWLDPAFRTWNIENRLPAVAAPALVVQGTDDPFGTLRQIDAIERGSGGPVRRLVLERCGHTPHREQRERTLAAMLAFLRSLPAE